MYWRTLILRLAFVEARREACTSGPLPAPTTITTVTLPLAASSSDTCQITNGKHTCILERDPTELIHLKHWRQCSTISGHRQLRITRLNRTSPQGV